MPTEIPDGKQVRFYREQVRKISQEKLASLSGVSLRTIQSIENDHPPTHRDVENLLALQDALAMPPGLIFKNGLPEPRVFLPFEKMNLARVAEVGRIAQSHLATASELRGFAEFLPCSIETDDFMCQHHESIYSQRYESHEPWTEIVNAYNTVGRNQRSGFDSRRTAWLFTHLMFESYFDELTDLRASQYTRVSVASRIHCLDRLRQLIASRTNADLSVALVPKPAESTIRQQFLMKHFLAYDSMAVIFNKLQAPVFSFYRRHSGEVGYTDRAEDVRRNAEFLDALHRAATITGSTLTVRIEAMIELLKGAS